jgi:Fe-S-cluster containining protein
MVSKTLLHKCLTPYRDLLTTIDQLLVGVRRRYSAQIACRKGCDCGCRNLSIFPIEALSLAYAMQDLPVGTSARIRKRAAKASFWECPLLEDRACNLYAFRPVICRTHGFPLQTIYNQRLSIGHCRYNFKNMSSIPDDAVIDLDHINGALRAINASAASEMADVLQLSDRFSIAEALLLTVF